MASNKNQHFVPRCYLKEFTFNSENKAINVYNIDTKRCIHKAPVKSQCSRDYFYGKDEKLESAIQLVERAYGSALHEIINRPRHLSENHIIVLKRFLLLQYFRTEAASKRSVEMNKGLTEVAGIQGEEFSLAIKEAVQIAMIAYADNMYLIDDLKICLIYNKTNFPFVTSDDPVVLSNKWYLDDWRTKFASFGLTACGVLLFLPLTPKILCVAYDGDVYSISNKNGWTTISHANDVKAFNEHQFLNCRANIFLKDVKDHPFVSESFDEVEHNRITARHRFNYAVLDYKCDKYSRYKVVDRAEANKHQEAIIHTQNIHHRPAVWPSIIQWRINGRVYTNRSGLGYLRKDHIAQYSGFFKEPIKLKKKRF
ncbi:DUF4238 domain-containing protein [Geomonas nitrogeniifigens]|uniref:DUF4238 domain-containing protein n=1 Tax=Geomonas diazotrophica TaxID=2843197 RepID=A0ABX8JL03_9BACT|nr:DUF4238 domain-containing protein [Geomonas nitrogeniifigens]QWV98661.1 DUF4238 domain-containing protein [Geomonas nitrogeniifigens]